ncbi:hypothetical protein [Rossellomorea vietnamensis]|nr:hypothetical protein [Rossellomorea vietnamensis]
MKKKIMAMATVSLLVIGAFGFVNSAAAAPADGGAQKTELPSVY